MPPEFSYRLNGTIAPMLYIFRERVDGKLTGWMRLTAVWIDGIGRFTIDDDTQPWEFTFPQRVLEYRNETEWESLAPSTRQLDKQEGWRRVAPHELLDVLESAGVIHCRES
jgi:hypothetical protein